VALQLADILLLLLLLVTVLFSISILFFTDRRPALAYLLAIYTPFQNVILPIIFALTTLPDPIGVGYATTKGRALEYRCQDYPHSISEDERAFRKDLSELAIHCGYVHCMDIDIQYRRFVSILNVV